MVGVDSNQNLTTKISKSERGEHVPYKPRRAEGLLTVLECISTAFEVILHLIQFLNV